MSATIASYLDGLDTFGVEVDDGVEQEMLAIIASSANVGPSLSLPPGLTPPNICAVQQAHKMEVSRIGNSLYREAANRLREIKVKSRRTRSATSYDPVMPRTEPFTIASVAKNLAELKAGFSASENEALRMHLLGAPWTQLVNDGSLVDPRGSGFFLISEEGQSTSTEAGAQKNDMTVEPDGVPTAFISYSWETEDHRLGARSSRTIAVTRS